MPSKRRAKSRVAPSPAPATPIVSSAGRSARFWVGLFIFQCFFGFSVFVLTKSHYERPSLAAARMVAKHQLDSQAIVTPSRQGAIASALSSPATSAQLSGSPSTALAGQPTTSLRAQASAAFTQSDYAKATRLYRELTARMPGDIEVRNNFAISAHYAGDSSKALDALQRSVKERPEHQRSWLTLGFINRAAGNVEAAKTAFQRAVEINPVNDIGAEARKFLQSLP